MAVTVAAVWSDIDVIRVRVNAKSELFSASTVVYTTDDLLRAAAAGMEGFPSNVNDVRRFRLSTTADDAVAIELKCVSAVGDAVLIADVQNHSGAVPERATIVIPVFAVYLDEFAMALRSMADRAVLIAELQG
jgi:sporulation protein YlmC with PRC-barrel domain